MSTDSTIKSCKDIDILLNVLSNNIEATVREEGNKGGRRYKLIKCDQKKDDGVSLSRIVQQLETIVKKGDVSDDQVFRALTVIKRLDLEGNVKLQNCDKKTIENTYERRCTSQSHLRYHVINKIAQKHNVDFAGITIDSEADRTAQIGGFYEKLKESFSYKNSTDIESWIEGLAKAKDVEFVAKDIEFFKDTAKAIIQAKNQWVLYDTVTNVYANFGSDKTVRESLALAVEGWIEAQAELNLRADYEQPSKTTRADVSGLLSEIGYSSGAGYRNDVRSPHSRWEKSEGNFIDLLPIGLLTKLGLPRIQSFFKNKNKSDT